MTDTEQVSGTEIKPCVKRGRARHAQAFSETGAQATYLLNPYAQ